MIKVKNYLVCFLSGISFMMSAHATTPDQNAQTLMTARDVQGPDLSNITLTNQTGAPITVSGLFIASFDINDCSSCFGSVVSGDNLGGAVVTPTTFNVNQSLPLGGNYLYNMIYNGIYYIKNTVGSSPCSLPGCSWPGDDPNVRGWCISINVVSPNSSYTYSHYTNGSNPPANTPAYSQAGNSTPFNYKYDLINPNTLGVGNACLGPITCSDKTLSCHVTTAQNESFQPYN
jgi:hypothetical protein